MWHEPFLKQYKRDSRWYRVECDLLVIDKDNRVLPLTPFEFSVDIVLRVHKQMAHIGKHKLENLVKRHFYHPAVNKIIADICTSCNHCQLFKVSSQSKSPPTLRIVSRYPYDLVAMDLLQFPRSDSGHNVALVVIDHCSKFLMAVPLKDKKSVSVCKALKTQIFPRMVKLPSRVLTDNGPEFRSAEFENTLSEVNISHIYSTRYRGQSNGAVERANRTITEFIRGIVEEDNSKWDVAINRAVIVYNNTWHSVIGDTPSNFLLSRSHNVDDTIPLDVDTMKTWIDAHPNFRPFVVGDRVALKLNKIGNKLQYKLGQKFRGPFAVIKVQSNEVTYEVSDGNEIIKAHHKQLKLWNDPPNYLSQRADVSGSDDESVLRVESNNSLSDDSSINFPVLALSSETSDHDTAGSNSDNEINKINDFSDCDSLVDPDTGGASWITEELVQELEEMGKAIDQYDLSVQNSLNIIDSTKESSTLNWSFTSDDFDVDYVPDIKMSTPMFVMERNEVEFSTNLSPIKSNSGNGDGSSSNLDSFMLWLEQSLHMQEEYVDRIARVTSTLNDGWIENVSDVLALDSCVDNEMQEERVDVLQNMSYQLKHMASRVSEVRKDNSNTSYRLQLDTNKDDSIIREVTDVVPDMVPSDVFENRRVTRSQGNVEQYPHVMSRPVEWKNYYRL